MLKARTRWSSFAVLAVLGVIVLLLAGCGTATTRAALLQPTASPTSVPPPPPANIPVYPGATLHGVQHTQVKSGQTTTWAYTADAANVTLADVTNYYRQNMPQHGWKEVQVAASGAPGGTSGATVLVYQQGQEMAIIAAGSNPEANPHQMAYVITQVK